MSGGAGTIRNNIFRDNIGNGIQMQDKGVGHSIGAVYVYGNKVYNNEVWHGIYARAYDIGGGCSNTSDIYVFNNLVWNNSWNGGAGYGIVATEDNDCPLHMSIYNNTVWNNKNGIIDDINAGAGEIRNNIVANNINSDFAYGITCSNPITTRSNNLSTAGSESGCGVNASFPATDFLSTDSSSVNFLKINNLNNAVDAGYNLSSIFTKDYAGESRDVNFDIGAYEYMESNLYRSDVDNSSVTNTTDALLTLRNSLGLSMNGTAWQVGATTGDVDCSGASNSTDALLILRYSLGLEMEETGWCE